MQEPRHAFGTTPAQALRAVREDIAYLRAAVTWSSCFDHHSAIHKFCRTLFHKRVISAAADADAEAQGRRRAGKSRLNRVLNRLINPCYG
jgi:hypothetical protein